MGSLEKLNCYLVRSSLSIILAFPSLAYGYYGAPYEPLDGYIYHGAGQDSNAVANYSAMFEDSTRRPLIVKSYIGLPGTRGMDVTRVLSAIRSSYSSGRVVELGLEFKGGRYGVTDSVLAVSSELDHYLDTLSLALAIYGEPVFLRIGFEFNGSWNGYHPWYYPLAFRKVVERVRREPEVEVATVWCYEPDAPADFAAAIGDSFKWYPGDEYVDWFGLDPFDADHFHPDLPDSNRGELTKKGRTEAFLRFADERGKPVMLNETTARHIYITPDSEDAPDYTDGVADWEAWFEPFFRFLDEHPAIKAIEYIDWDWTKYPQWEDWGDARIEINSYIQERWVAKLSEPRFIGVGGLVRGISEHIDTPSSPPVLFQVNPFPMDGLITAHIILSSPQNLKLSLYDILGREIKIIYKGNFPTGDHTFHFDTHNISSGIYFIVLSTSKKTISKKVLINK